MRRRILIINFIDTDFKRRNCDLLERLEEQVSVEHAHVPGDILRALVKSPPPHSIIVGDGSLVLLKPVIEVLEQSGLAALDGEVSPNEQTRSALVQCLKVDENNSLDETGRFFVYLLKSCKLNLKVMEVALIELQKYSKSGRVIFSCDFCRTFIYGFKKTTFTSFRGFKLMRLKELDTFWREWGLGWSVAQGNTGRVNADLNKETELTIDRRFRIVFSDEAVLLNVNGEEVVYRADTHGSTQTALAAWGKLEDGVVGFVGTSWIQPWVTEATLKMCCL